MKKKMSLIIAVFLICIIGTQNVYADDSDLKEAVNNKEAILVCEYGNESVNSRVRIYYKFMTKDEKSVGYISNGYGPWFVYTAKKGSNSLELIKNASRGQFSTVFDGGVISYQSARQAFPTNYENSFECQPYAVLNYDEDSRVCFSSTGDCQNAKYNSLYGLTIDNSSELRKVKDLSQEEYKEKYGSSPSPSTTSPSKETKPKKTVNPEDFNHNCRDFHKVFKTAGYAILLLKIAVPLIIIFKSSLNLTKVVTSGNQDELKKQATKLMYSLIAGIAIFFVPTVINAVMGLVDEYSKGVEGENDAKICRECIFNPTGTTCSSIPDDTDQ